MNKFNFLTPEFIAAHKKATGICVILDIFPWKYLGCTDEEFMADKICFSHGPVIPEKQKHVLLGLVRQQEKELLEQHNYITKREKAIGKPEKQIQLELF